MRLIDKLLIEKGMKEDRKITQKKAAEELKISPVTFHQILTNKVQGVRGTAGEAKVKIADYFDLSVEDLDKSIESEYPSEVKTDE